METAKMKVEVWSDIMCPFCYIGKRNYEAALGRLKGSSQVEIEWHSFQLDPAIPLKMEKKENVYEYLAGRKGMSYEQSVEMHERVVQTARNAGLTYNFDKAVVANSFDAHKLIQLAKTKGLGDEAEERLFQAYFTEGKDFGDHDTLLELGKEIGLDETEIREAVTGDAYGVKVKQDIEEAQRLGIRGVPFFILDRKYAVSGAQPPAVFLEALQKSLSEWQTEHANTGLQVTDGPVCTPEGDCN